LLKLLQEWGSKDKREGCGSEFNDDIL
jgi:hypothetical protein